MHWIQSENQPHTEDHDECSHQADGGSWAESHHEQAYRRGTSSLGASGDGAQHEECRDRGDPHGDGEEHRRQASSVVLGRMVDRLLDVHRSAHDLRHGLGLGGAQARHLLVAVLQSRGQLAGTGGEGVGALLELTQSVGQLHDARDHLGHLLGRLAT